MEPHEDYSVLRVVGERALDSEVNDRLSSLQAVGNSAVSSFRKCMAIGGAIGLLASMGPLTAEADTTDAYTSLPEVTLAAKPHQPRAEKHHKSSAVSHTGHEEPLCTDIVPFPGGYYFGEACSNDRIVELGESKSHQFIYGMIMMRNGTDKCGFVEKGFVPIERSPHKSAEYCNELASRDILNPHDSIKDMSCNPGACSYGTPTSPTPDCRPKVEMYANFTTATRSAFNVYPNGKSGFVGLKGEQSNNISYRATVKQSSRVGLAAIIYGKQVGWALTEQKCVPERLLIKSHATNNSPPIKLG
jgi:hypothetical protein